jgi:hypothetical protein
MRIWSLHPRYLDAKGLVALWRETLLAKHVLEEKTKGYKHHPQLNRFKQAQHPLHCINYYLSVVYDEAAKRGYNFDSSKFNSAFAPKQITVTKGQLEYEANHLLHKLKNRDKKKYDELICLKKFSPHPLFKTINGNVENWEIVN